MPIVLKSGSLNLLEPSGPVKACNEIALPLLYYPLDIKCLHGSVQSLFLFIEFMIHNSIQNKKKNNQLEFHTGTELLSLHNRHRVMDYSMKKTVTLFLCCTQKLVHVCSGLSLNCGCHYVAEDMALKVYAVVETV
jgi:hypothetical protein